MAGGPMISEVDNYGNWRVFFMGSYLTGYANTVHMCEVTNSATVDLTEALYPSGNGPYPYGSWVQDYYEAENSQTVYSGEDIAAFTGFEGGDGYHRVFYLAANGDLREFWGTNDEGDTHWQEAQVSGGAFYGPYVANQSIAAIYNGYEHVYTYDPGTNVLQDTYSN